MLITAQLARGVSRTFNCQNSVWQLKVLETPRRELQDDWFLFFAKRGETALLAKLFSAVTDQGVIIDNRAICYAALYLMEIEDSLSIQGWALRDQLVGQVQLDKYLLQDSQSLSAFFRKMSSDIKIFREETIKSFKMGRELPIPRLYPGFFATYLGEYVRDYTYRNTRDILPSLISYAKDLENTKKYPPVRTSSTYFMQAMAGEMVRAGELDKVSSLLAYIRDSEYFDEDASNATVYSEVFEAVLSNGTYEEARSMDNSDEVWREGAHISSYPVDPEIYFALVELRDYNDGVLANGLEALEAEDYLDYLDALLAEELITAQKHLEALTTIKIRADRGGYTNAALVFRDSIL